MSSSTSGEAVTTGASDEEAAVEPAGGFLTFVQRPKVRLALLAVVALAATAAVFASGGLDREAVRELVEGLGWFGPIAFVLLYAVLTVLFVPGLVLTIVGGAVFGALLGSFLVVIGATLGATASFLLGRRIGREGVEQMGAKTVRKLDAFVTERGFIAILIARLVPIFPFNLLNYASGVTGIRTREYVVATALGIIPGTYAYAALGGSLGDWTSPEFLTAAGMVVVLGVGGTLYARWSKPVQSATSDADA